MTKPASTTLGISLIVFLAIWVKGQSLPDIFPQQSKASEVLTAYYNKNEITPAATVQVKGFFTDYERRGFFTIGVLPVEILDGVSIEIFKPGPVTNRLCWLNDWVGQQTSKRMEFRNVNILTAAGGGTNRLECGRARFLAGGRCQLLNGVRFWSGTNAIEAAQATLQVSGNNAGTIIIMSPPASTNQLFTQLNEESKPRKNTQ